MRPAVLAAWSTLFAGLIACLVYIITVSAGAGALKQQVVELQQYKTVSEINDRTRDDKLEQFGRALSRIEQKQDDLLLILRHPSPIR